MAKDNKNEAIAQVDNEAKDNISHTPSDANMPKQKTMNYNQDIKLKTTDLFVQLFTAAVNSMPYSHVIDINGKKIKLIEFVKDVESHNRIFTIKELNETISIIAACPFGYVRDLMGLIENKQAQNQLWTAAEQQMAPVLQ